MYAQAACAGEMGSDAAVRTFIDRFIDNQMRERHVPGAAVVVVRDGKVIVSKAYGWANVEQRRLVDVEETIFPVGSLSKPITAVAVMQLWEQGRVRLHEDILSYAPELTVMHGGGASITLHHLLTHTAGYDPVMLAMGARTSSELLPLGDFVIHHVPPRPLPPGRLINYANYDYALAGYIVERVSDEPFAQYMSQHIFKPLGMHRSSFSAAIHENSNFAVGYDWKDEQFRPVLPIVLHSVPASGLCATAADMAQFILFQLDASRNGPEILKPETRAMQHRTQFSHHPALPGWTYGFAERGNETADTSERVLEHGGVWTGFTCKLLLIPERDTGLFVIYNRYETPLLDELSKAFLRRFYPRVDDAVNPLPSTQTRSRAELSRYVGRYRNVGYSHGTFEKLRILWKSYTEILFDPTDPAVLLMRSPHAGPTRLLPTADPLLFIREKTGQPVAFSLSGPDGKALLFAGTSAMERAAWWEAPTAQIVVFLGFALLFAMTSFALAVRCIFAWVRKIGGRAGSGNFGCRWTAIACALANGGFIAALAMMLFLYDQREFLFGLPLTLQMLLRLPLVGGSLALLTILFALTGSPQMTRARRLRYTVFACVAVAFLPFLMYWNLLLVEI